MRCRGRDIRRLLQYIICVAVFGRKGRVTGGLWFCGEGRVGGLEMSELGTRRPTVRTPSFAKTKVEKEKARRMARVGWRRCIVGNIDLIGLW